MKFPEHLRIRRMKGAPDRETDPGDQFGWFVINPCTLVPYGLKIMACDGEYTGWDHCSVSRIIHNSCPTWYEMKMVKELFWDDSECVVQFHPPKADNISIHDYVLHLWRKVGDPFPMPPWQCI